MVSITWKAANDGASIQPAMMQLKVKAPLSMPICKPMGSDLVLTKRVAFHESGVALKPVR